jgi:O-acetyl-ADP-ribose deacetylase (regulator of RNase III)
MSTNSRIIVQKGDITQMDTDAIVNAANTTLMGGGGVDGAIHRAAGPELKKACEPLAPCPAGEARITPGFNLKARFVIHTVGPVYNGGHRGEAQKLTSAYRNSLKLATENKLHTIAFPSISTGAYRYPLKEAAPLAIETIRAYLQNNTLPERVYMVCFDDLTLQHYKQSLEKITGD